MIESSIPSSSSKSRYERDEIHTRKQGVSSTIHENQSPLVKPIVRFFFYLFVASIPFEVINVGGSGFFSLSKMVGIPFALVAILYESRIVMHKPPRALWAFAFYVVFMGLRGLAGDSVYLPGTILRLFQLGQLLILFALSYHMLQNQVFSRRVLLAFSNSAFILASLSLLGGPFVNMFRSGEVDRVGAIGWSLNSLGGIFATAGVAFIGLAFGMRKKSRFITRGYFGVALVILTVALARTGSRSAMLGLVAGAMILFLQRAKTPITKLKTLFMGIAVLLLLFTLISHIEVANTRWRATIDRQDTASRQSIFAASLTAFYENPIIGWGPGKNLRVIGGKIGRIYVDTHNSLLWVLTETGLVGGIPFLFGFYFCFRSSWRARKGPMGILPLALIVCVMVINSANTAINMKYTWLVFVYALASDPFILEDLARNSERALYIRKYNNAYGENQ